MALSLGTKAALSFWILQNQKVENCRLLVSKATPAIDDVKEGVTKLRDRNVAGIYSISADLLIAEAEAMIRVLGTCCFDYYSAFIYYFS